METIYLQGGKKFDYKTYMQKKGFDVVGTTGQGGVEGVMDIFNPKERSDVRLKIRHRETGENKIWDVQDFIRRKGMEPDMEKTFNKAKEIRQAENEVAERQQIKDTIKKFEKDFGLDFSKKLKGTFPGLSLPGKGEDTDATDELDFFNAVMFPNSKKLQESGKYEEKMGGWFPKKYGSAAMDVASLVVRTPIAAIDDILYEVTKGEKGAPFSVSMAGVADYGAQEKADGEQESLKEHFGNLQEAFRYDPLRVLKDVGRESLRDPLSGVALVASLGTGGAAAPAAGTRAAMILGKLGKGYKSMAGKTGAAKQLKRVGEISKKVNNKIEQMNPVGRALTKTGLAVTAEGSIGAAQGYLGKIFQGGDATYRDALIEGIEEGAFGLFSSSFMGVGRAAWEKMSPEQKFTALDDLRDQTKEVEAKVESGVAIEELSLEERRLLSGLSKYSALNQTVEHSPSAPSPVKVTEQGETLVQRNGDVESIPLTEPLPPDVDKNDVQKKRENPAHIDKGTKAQENEELKTRNQNSKNIKAAKKEQEAFDSEVNSNIKQAVDEAVAETDAQEQVEVKEQEEFTKSTLESLDKVFDPNQNLTFAEFQNTLGKGMTPDEQRASFTNMEIAKQKANQYLEEVKGEKDQRAATRKELLESGKLRKGSLVPTGLDVTYTVGEDGKISFQDHMAVKNHMIEKKKRAGEKKPEVSDEEVRAAIENGYTIKSKRKKVGGEDRLKIDADQDMDYRRTSLSNQMEMDPNSDFFTEGVLAENAPDEFTTHGNYYKKVKRRDGSDSFITYKDVNDRQFEFQKGDVIYTDPQFLEPVQPESRRNYEEEIVEFADRMAAKNSSLSYAVEKPQNVPYVKTDGTEEIAPVTAPSELNEGRQNSEEIRGRDIEYENRGRGSEGAYSESDTESAEVLKNQFAEKATEYTAIIESLKAKKKPSEGDLKAIAIGQYLSEKRAEVDVRLSERAKIQESIKSLNLRLENSLERLTRSGSNKAEKVEKHSADFDHWDNNPDIMEPPPAAPDLSREESTTKKSYEDIEVINRKIDENEKALDNYDDVDHLDLINQEAFVIFQKASKSGFKSFKDVVIGQKPKKYSENVSPQKWNARIEQIKEWEIKDSGIENMIASSFPTIHQVSPELADMAAKMAWKGKMPTNLKDAKNKAHNWLQGQEGSVNTAVFREAMKFGAFTALSGGPLGGLVSHAGLNFLLPIIKRSFNSSVGKFTLHSLRAQLLTKRAFSRVVPRIDQAFHLKNNRINKYTDRYKKATKGLDKEEKLQMRDYIEGRNNDVSERVVAAGEKVRSIFLDVANLANQHGWDFPADHNYFTRVVDFEAIREMKDNPEIFEQEVQHLMANEDMSREDAAALLMAYFDNSDEMRSVRDKKERAKFMQAAMEKSGTNMKKFHYLLTRQKTKMNEHTIGSLNYKRTAPRLTSAMYVQNIDGIMENYIYGTMQAITYREKFGKNLSMINNALLSQFGIESDFTTSKGNKVKRKTGEISEEGQVFRDYIQAELYNRSIVMKWGADPNSFTAKTAARFTRYQYWSKLMTSILSPIRNTITAGVMSASIHGVSATGMGVLRTMGGLVKGEPYRNAHLAGAITDQTMIDATGSELFKKGKAESFIEAIHPFVLSEKFVRAAAYNGGITHAKRMFGKAKKGDMKAAKTLTDIIGGERLTEALAMGELKGEALEVAAASAASDVAGHARVMNVSPFLSSPEGKLVGQYRRIAFHQTTVFKDKILIPATQMNIMPLLRWGTAVGIAGPTMLALSAALYGEKEEKERSTPGGEVWNLLTYINQVNSLGLYGDLAASMEHGTGFGEVPIVGTFTGPTISSIINATVDIWSITKDGADPGETLGDLIRKEIPGVRQAEALDEAFSK